jgi:hypothetical protein
MVKVIPVDLEVRAAAAVVVLAKREPQARRKETEMVATAVMEFLTR